MAICTYCKFLCSFLNISVLPLVPNLMLTSFLIPGSASIKAFLNGQKVDQLQLSLTLFEDYLAKWSGSILVCGRRPRVGCALPLERSTDNTGSGQPLARTSWYSQGGPTLLATAATVRTSAAIKIS